MTDKVKNEQCIYLSSFFYVINYNFVLFLSVKKIDFGVMLLTYSTNSLKK